MRLEESVGSVVELLRDWQRQPKYKVEPRIDAWLAPFLPRALARRSGGRVSRPAIGRTEVGQAEGTGAATSITPRPARIPATPPVNDFATD